MIHAMRKCKVKASVLDSDIEHDTGSSVFSVSRGEICTKSLEIV